MSVIKKNELNESSGIKIIIKKPHENQELKVVTNEFKDFQKIVGGYIEIVEITKDILMVCNEEGKLNNLRPNLLIPNDTVVGTVFFCSEDENTNFASLTESQIKFVTEFIEKNRYL